MRLANGPTEPDNDNSSLIARWHDRMVVARHEPFERVRVCARHVGEGWDETGRRGVGHGRSSCRRRTILPGRLLTCIARIHVHGWIDILRDKDTDMCTQSDRTSRALFVHD